MWIYGRQSDAVLISAGFQQARVKRLDTRRVTVDAATWAVIMHSHISFACRAGSFCTRCVADSCLPVGARPQRIRLPEVHHGRVGVGLLRHPEGPHGLRLVEVPGLQQPLHSFPWLPPRTLLVEGVPPTAAGTDCSVRLMASAVLQLLIR